MVAAMLVQLLSLVFAGLAVWNASAKAMGGSLVTFMLIIAALALWGMARVLRNRALRQSQAPSESSE